MQEAILKAVANPPRILWGPFLPTLMNLGLQFPFMFIAAGVFQANPLLFMVTILLGHIGCVMAGVKEPHLSSMIQAFGQANISVHNLYNEKGRKFEP